MLRGDLKHLLSTNTHEPWRGVAMLAQHWMWLLTSWNQPGTRTPCTLCDGYKAKVSWHFWCCCAHLCHCLSTGKSSSSGPSKKCFWQITLFSTFFTVTTTSAETPECHLLVCHWWVLTFRHQVVNWLWLNRLRYVGLLSLCVLFCVSVYCVCACTWVCLYIHVYF